jgi:hypothetical protein
MTKEATARTTRLGATNEFRRAVYSENMSAALVQRECELTVTTAYVEHVLV